MAVRGAFAVGLMLVILPVLGLRIGWPERFTWLRAAGEVAVTFTFLQALARLPIGDTYTLYFAGPLLLTAGAALFLGERVGPRRWAAVLVGFLGVLVVLGLPQQWQAASLIALTAAFLSVARDLTTRWIPPAVGSGTVAALTSVCVALSGLATAAGRQLGAARLGRRRPVRARGLRRRRRLHRLRHRAAHGRALLRRHLPLRRHPHGHAPGPRRLGRRAEPAHAGRRGADHGRRARIVWQERAR